MVHLTVRDAEIEAEPVTAPSATPPPLEAEMPTNIPDPDEMNEQRALWCKAALRQYPHAVGDLRQLDNVAANFLADLAHLADECGWKLVELLRRARASYDLETEDHGEQ